MNWDISRRQIIIFAPKVNKARNLGASVKMFTVGIVIYFPLSINFFTRQKRKCFGEMLTFFFVLCCDVLKSLSERANDITHVKIIARLIHVMYA